MLILELLDSGPFENALVRSEMKVSVVIPVLNEERLLPLLLESLESQSFRDFEVLVADAGSTDRTVEIAHQFGARVVPGGRPAKGRNSGAAAARGEFLFFLDGDVKLPPDFLEFAIAEMQEQGFELATAWFDPDSAHPLDLVAFNLANLFVKISLRSDPHAAGFAIFVRKSLFERAGGFDETLHIAEDHEFVRRAANLAPLNMLKTTRLTVSVRRLEKEGRISYAGKCVRVELHRLFRGEIDSDIIEYEFGNFSDVEQTVFDRRIKDFLDRIAAINQFLNEAISRSFKNPNDDVVAGDRVRRTVAAFRDLREGIRKVLVRERGK